MCACGTNRTAQYRYLKYEWNSDNSNKSENSVDIL